MHIQSIYLIHIQYLNINRKLSLHVIPAFDTLKSLVASMFGLDDFTFRYLSIHGDLVDINNDHDLQSFINSIPPNSGDSKDSIHVQIFVVTPDDYSSSQSCAESNTEPIAESNAESNAEPQHVASQDFTNPDDFINFIEEQLGTLSTSLQDFFDKLELGHKFEQFSSDAEQRFDNIKTDARAQFDKARQSFEENYQQGIHERMEKVKIEFIKLSEMVAEGIEHAPSFTNDLKQKIALHTNTAVEVISQQAAMAREKLSSINSDDAQILLNDIKNQLGVFAVDAACALRDGFNFLATELKNLNIENKEENNNEEINEEQPVEEEEQEPVEEEQQPVEEEEQKPEEQQQPDIQEEDEEYMITLQLLNEMGFTNRERNIQLMNENEGDLFKVVGKLIQE